MAEPADHHTSIPLCIKLNHTLIATDIVLEAMVSFLHQNPLLVFHVLFWRFRGKSYFEEQVLQGLLPNGNYPANNPLAGLPFRKKVVDFIEAHKDNGRTIILIDTVHVDYLQIVGGGLKLFDGVMVAENSVALLAKLKRKYADGYDLIGGTNTDLALLSVARLCYLVEPSTLVLAQARRTATIETVFKTKRDKIKIFFQTVHIKRYWWLLPIFAPLLFKPAAIPASLPTIISVFLLYFIVALGFFILNDIYNIALLRHQAKRRSTPTPLAVGLFKISAGLKLSTFFIVAGIVLSLSQFSGPFNLVLWLFIALSICWVLSWSRYNMLRNVLLILLGGLLILASYIALIFDNRWYNV